MAEDKKRSSPPTVAIIQAPDVQRWNRSNFVGITAQRLSAVLSGAKRGTLEDFADLCTHMLRTDPHLRALVNVHTAAITSATWEVGPGRGDSHLAEEAAEFIRFILENQQGTTIEDWWNHLLFAEDVGWAGGHQYFKPAVYKGQRVWIPVVKKIHPRDIRFSHDWVPELRTYEDGTQATWVRVDRLHPASYLVHTPSHIGDTPNVAGSMWAVIWPWFTKFWGQLYRSTALERHAVPFMYAIVNPNTPEAVRSKILNNLENFRSDQSAWFEALPGGGDPIRLLESAKDPAEAYTNVIRHIDEQMSKALLGSTMALEATDRGARSLGESINDVAVTPLLMSQARRLASSEERRFAEILKINAHIFGTIPPTPQLYHQLFGETAPKITKDAIETGWIKVDEFRSYVGLDPLGPPEGDQFIRKEEVQEAIQKVGRKPLSDSEPMADTENE